MFVERHAEMAESDSDKQYPRYSEFNAGDLELAQSHTERNDQRQYQYRVCYSATPKCAVSEEQVMKKFHKTLTLFILRKRKTIKNRSVISFSAAKVTLLTDNISLISHF